VPPKSTGPAKLGYVASAVVNASTDNIQDTVNGLGMLLLTDK